MCGCSWLVMGKKYFFLTGISRAGNTTFASIINQNPDIAVTANSIVPTLFWNVHSVKQEEEFINFPDSASVDSLLDNILPSYYKGWKQKYIIDRSSWGLLDYFKLLKKHVKNDIKIIVLVRDVVEVLASFVKFSNDNPNFFLNKVGKTEEEKCDYLMRYTQTNDVGQVYGQLSAIKNLVRDENKKYIHIIEYDELVNNPEKTIDGVYEFLDIPKFKHRFKNLQQIRLNDVAYNDEVLGGDLHKIRSCCVKKSDYKVSDVLPENVINKYSGLNLWRGVD